MKNEIRKYLKKYGTRSIVFVNTFRLFVAFSALIFILLVVSYNLILNIVNKKSMEVNDVELQRISFQFEDVFRNLEYTAAEILTSDAVNEFMSLSETGHISENTLDKIIEILEIYLKSSRNSNMEIYLYNANKDVFCTKEGLKYTDELEGSFFLSKHYTNDFNDYKIIPKFVDKYINKFVFIKKAPHDNGFIALEIIATNLKRDLKQRIGNVYNFYVFQNNEVIFTNANEIDEEILSSQYKNRNNVYSVQESKYYDFKYVLESHTNHISDNFNYVYSFFCFILIASILLAMAISAFLSLNGMNYILGFIDLLDEGKRPKKISKNEIKYITDKIIQVLDDNNELKTEIENRVVQYDELKRKILQSQIKPHFINNSLNAIIYSLITECGYDTKTASMISKLSEIISYNTIDNDIFIPLWKEIDYIKKYVEFLQYRYDGINFEIYASEKIQDIKVPKMCLQPFVENSVFYGIGESGGNLKITCNVSKDKLIIEVYDDGAGMSEDNIKEVMKRMKTEEVSVKHIGITNVFNRMKLLYGDEANIEIQSELGKFTCVRLYIPN